MANLLSLKSEECCLLDFCAQLWNQIVKKVYSWTSGPSQHNLPSGSDLQRERWRRTAKEHLCQGAET